MGGVGVANREIGVPGAAVGWVGGGVVVGEGEDWLGGVGWGLGDGSGDGSKDPPLHLAGAGGGVGEGDAVGGEAGEGGNGRG